MEHKVYSIFENIFSLLNLDPVQIQKIYAIQNQSLFEKFKLQQIILHAQMKVATKLFCLSDWKTFPDFEERQYVFNFLEDVKSRFLWNDNKKV